MQVAQRETTDMVSDDVYFVQDGDRRPWDTLLSLGSERYDGPTHVDAVQFVNTNMPGKARSRLGLTKPLMRRSFLIQYGLLYDEKIHGCDEDFHLYLACLLNGARFVVLPEPYYFYRRRRGSLMAGNRLDVLETIRGGNVRLLQQEIVREDPNLVGALSERLLAVNERIVYYKVLAPFKQRNFSQALSETLRNPIVLKLLAAQIPVIVHYRARRLAGKVLRRSSVEKTERPSRVPA
ncbi:hypothetical protein BH23PAT1_BH23PAT1_0090 [soil metagenome]